MHTTSNVNNKEKLKYFDSIQLELILEGHRVFRGKFGWRFINILLQLNDKNISIVYCNFGSYCESNLVYVLCLDLH